MLGSIIRQAKHRIHPANQRPRKPDKLSQGAHNQTSYPKIKWENTLEKRGTTEPQGQQKEEQHTERIPSNDRGECMVKEQEQEHMTAHAAGS